MPKERIKSKYHDVNDSMEPLVHVGWTKDRDHVEISVVNGDPNKGLAQFDKDLNQWVTLDSIDRYHNGWFAQMDRNGINRLIRALRKARDEAYGKDA